VRIGITGTPGTGKSTVSTRLEGEVIDISSFLRENGVGERMDNGEISVSRKRLRETVPDAGRRQILDGHLSHLLALDRCIVLRTRPDKLRQRLEERSYSRQKVEENVEAEALDFILSEAVEIQESIHEIDTTSKKPKKVVKDTRKFIETGEGNYGDIHWTEWI
jgi:Predicted nucleotide kinase (related to CMP and AMP kinases)